MPQLRNIRHEKFAQSVACGLPQSEAYRRVAGRGPSAKNANVHANEWANCSGVKERITELQAENARKCEVSREELLQFLTAVVRAKPSEASVENSHCEITFSRNDREVVFPSKLQAVAQLCKMCNFNAPEKVSIDAGDSLSALLRDIVTK